MKKFRVPKNLNNEQQERELTSRTRLFACIGGVAVSAASIAVMLRLEPLSVSRDRLRLPALVGVVATVFAIVAELQERQKKGGDEEDGGGRRWDWGGPGTPPLPIQPNEDGVDLISQIEEYLQEQELVTV